jgi:hypothetical protein
MKFRNVAVLLFLLVGFMTLIGCEGPTQKSYYYSEYQYPPYPSGPQVDFYDPSGDPAYSYDPVYAPIQRPPTYNPGTPAYEYSYYYSRS